MAPSFYERVGSRLSPGDIFDTLPYTRVQKPLQVVRKTKVTLPNKLKDKVQGELREVFEVGKHIPDPPFDFEATGEEILSHAKTARAIFLTWGSEVDADMSAGKLHKKDWLIAPLFSLKGLEGREVVDSRIGAKIDLAAATRAGKSPKYFPLPPFPDETSSGYYVDFRKIFPLAANHFQELPREWRLTPAALNDFYSQLLWFFTRKRLFFGPVVCASCGTPVDLGITFEGQPLDADPE